MPFYIRSDPDPRRTVRGHKDVAQYLYLLV
ncbi:hypothetical protein RCV-Z_ORF41 [Rana catesbeiana virus]|uniref:Uncharacterized protein n=1 Tax=Frog virus 3 TaxID=10493 RepID=A0A2U7M3K0_FRG3V|nr:hypothetical protein FV3_ORF66 [Frog virus 3]API65350.1 hypothetical protein RCV-Z_ORF41 [Rana catesbeiana virus]